MKVQAGERVSGYRSTPGSRRSKVQPIELTVYGMTDPGRTRARNEDAFLITCVDAPEEAVPPGSMRAVDLRSTTVLLALADGLGGENAGEVASQLTLDSLHRALRARLERLGPVAALTEAVKIANEEVMAAARGPEREGMGATLVAALAVSGHAFVASVGDSRMYVAREGRLVQITKDQNLFQRAKDTGATILNPADVSRYKNTLLQAIGRSSIDEVTVDRIALRRGDILLLCTDGLSNELRDDDINLILSTEPWLDTASRCLISFANARGGRDNMTVVLAGVSGSGVPPPAPSEPISAT